LVLSRRPRVLKGRGASNAVIAPHGKTTMSPQLFRRQIDDGAWAITVANAQQAQVARYYGFQRIVLANQLVGKQFVRWGKADIVTPTDHFAPRDFLGVIDNEFLPVTGVRGVVRFGARTGRDRRLPASVAVRNPAPGDGAQ
jgi:D-serine dehydratase